MNLTNVQLEIVFNVGSVGAIRATERLDGQVCGEMALQVPVAGEAAATCGASVV